MKLKRGQPRTASISAKFAAFVAFIIVVSFFASINTTLDRVSPGFPLHLARDQHSSLSAATTVRSYSTSGGSKVVEHDFSSLVDPQSIAGADELDAELAKDQEQQARRAADQDEAEVENIETKQELELLAKELSDAQKTSTSGNDDDNDDGDRPEVVAAAQNQHLQVVTSQHREPPLKRQYPRSGRPSKQVMPSRRSRVDKYHVVVTVSDGIYVEWQARVCYYWYKKIKSEYPDSAMGGFTRVLHSGVPDDWMDEIPTVVVNPLPPEYESIVGGYVVLNRPYGLLQWVQEYLENIPENYVLMAEPDHIFIRPIPLLATPETAAAFPFFYIEPQVKENADIIEKYNKNNVPLKDFAPIGNSPVMIHRDQMKPVVELWSNLSLTIKQDKEADSKWGWIQEMYAWSIASTQVEPLVKYSLFREMMLQPPWDDRLEIGGKPAYIIHFTYGDDFDENGQFTPGKVGAWHFDKRDHTGKYPPMNIPMPPEGCTNEVVKRLIASINEASANLPDWANRAHQSPEEVKLYSYGNEKETSEEEFGEEEEQQQGGGGRGDIEEEEFIEEYVSIEEEDETYLFEEDAMGDEVDAMGDEVDEAAGGEDVGLDGVEEA